MACKVCNGPSGFRDYCTNCSKLVRNSDLWINNKKLPSYGEWLGSNKNKGFLSYKKWLIEKKKNIISFMAFNKKSEELSYRDMFPAIYATDDGHSVRFLAEQTIDNWLYSKGIIHSYEKKLDDNDVFCDFFIPLGGNLHIEYWSNAEDKFLKRKDSKKSFYQNSKKNVIELSDNDISNLDNVLPKKIKEYMPKNFKIKKN